VQDTFIGVDVAQDKLDIAGSPGCEATCPRAWTPASVRPATVSCVVSRRSVANADSTVDWIEGTLG